MPIRVFVFEDEWPMREALTSVLGRDQNVEIVGVADNVDEGFDHAISAQPDVVLMDVRFDGENRGIEATAKLKQRLPDTQIAIFTELDDVKILDDAIHAGALGFLYKREVSDPRILLDAIHTVVRGEYYVTPKMTTKVVRRGRTRDPSVDNRLTPRELQVLSLFCEGKEIPDIAEQLCISVYTVRNHIRSFTEKLSTTNQRETCHKAREKGLL